jgi:hypothetical protein
MPCAITSAIIAGPSDMLERVVIVGTLALDSNEDIAKLAAQLLEVDAPAKECARFTAEFRRMMAPVEPSDPEDDPSNQAPYVSGGSGLPLSA